MNIHEAIRGTGTLLEGPGESACPRGRLDGLDTSGSSESVQVPPRCHLVPTNKTERDQAFNACVVGDPLSSECNKEKHVIKRK